MDDMAREVGDACCGVNKDLAVVAGLATKADVLATAATTRATHRYFMVQIDTLTTDDNLPKNKRRGRCVCVDLGGGKILVGAQKRSFRRHVESFGSHFNLHGQMDRRNLANTHQRALNGRPWE